MHTHPRFVDALRTVRRCTRYAILLVTLASAGAGALAQQIRHFQDPGARKLAPYSPAVSANGFVFISGVVPLVPETGKPVGADLDAQVHQVFSNLKRALALADARLDDVVKVSVFLKNPADFPAMNRIYATYFADRLPARTTVPGVGWGNDFLIEIDAIAVDRLRPGK